jgi:hypothetical protein
VLFQQAFETVSFLIGPRQDKFLVGQGKVDVLVANAGYTSYSSRRLRRRDDAQISLGPRQGGVFLWAEAIFFLGRGRAGILVGPRLAWQAEVGRGKLIFSPFRRSSPTHSFPPLFFVCDTNPNPKPLSLLFHSLPYPH